VIKHRLEKDEQHDVQQLLQAINATTFVTGTRRPAGRLCQRCGHFVGEDQAPG
jgi:hypothetical protein